MRAKKNVVDLNGYRRIAISGAHGCGKTFLGERISQATGVPFVPEFARDLMSAVNFNWKKDDPEGVVLFQKAIYYSHAFIVACLPEFISDRSVLDVRAYCSWHILGNSKITDRQRRDLSEIAKETKGMLAKYDLILFYRLERSYAVHPDPSQVFIDRRLHDDHREILRPKVVEIGRGDEIRFRDVKLYV